MSGVKWQEILNKNDANDDNNTLNEQFNKEYDECIPLKKCTIIRKRNHISLWTCHKGLLKSISKKKNNNIIQSPTNGNLQKFKTRDKNKLNMLIRKSKRMYLYINKIWGGKKKLRMI